MKPVGRQNPACIMFITSFVIGILIWGSILQIGLSTVVVSAGRRASTSGGADADTVMDEPLQNEPAVLTPDQLVRIRARLPLNVTPETAGQYAGHVKGFKVSHIHDMSHFQSMKINGLILSCMRIWQFGVRSSKCKLVLSNFQDYWVGKGYDEDVEMTGEMVFRYL